MATTKPDALAVVCYGAQERRWCFTVMCRPHPHPLHNSHARDTVEVVEQAGRGFTTCINLLGMGWLGPLWAIKDRISTLPLPGAASICDRAMWYLNPLMPHPLSTPLRRLAVEWDHHLLVETAEYGQVPAAPPPRSRPSPLRNSWASALPVPDRPLSVSLGCR